MIVRREKVCSHNRHKNEFEKFFLIKKLNRRILNILICKKVKNNNHGQRHDMS